MPRKNKKWKQPQAVRQKQPAPSNNSSPTHEVKEPTFQEKIALMANTILSKAAPQDLDQVQNTSMPPGINIDDVARLYDELDQAWKLFEIQRKRLEQEREAFEKNSAQLAERQVQLREAEQSLSNRRDDYERRRKKLDDDLKELASSQKQLRELTADLDRREQEARFGFQDIYQDTLEKEHVRLDAFSSDLERLGQEFSSKRRDELVSWQTKLAEISEAAEQHILHQLQALEAQREKLVEEEREIEQQRMALRRERNAVAADRQMLEEDKQSQKEIVEQQLAARIEGYKTKLESLEALHKQAASDRDLFKSKLLAWDKVRQRVGKDSEIILETVEQLTQERDQLAKELHARPSEINVQRIEELEGQQADWELERWNLVQQNSELKSQLTKNRIQALEVENQRDLILALEARGKVLDAQLKELKTDVERRIGQHQSQSPFPQCYAFDQDLALQSKFEAYAPEDLRNLVEEIQMRIATGGLFYELRDIRSFLAGLGMSKTTILQGISGTGKTSLPIKFADAIGGGREVVEVQAGWRDRDDLLGHYNAFEQKFYESKFLQALYQAQCPAYADRVFIILLDEMNLSYAEQYFADLLSVLQIEAGTQHRKIDLIPAAIPAMNYPREFVNNNRSIRVSDNVWFVGTANQDETTKDIADKTYDRSHIMELPLQHPRFDVQRIVSAPRHISRTALSEAFKKARNTASYQADATRTWKFLESVRLDFNAQYALGWGNRLRRQIEDYVPIVIASGGTWSEATDNILSMKVLRKLRNRYEIQASELEQLEGILVDAWKKNSAKESIEVGLPRSIQLIRDEQRKKTSRQADEAD